MTNTNCYFCESSETKFCPICDKYLCDVCRANYPKRIFEAAKLGIDNFRRRLQR